MTVVDVTNSLKLHGIFKAHGRSPLFSAQGLGINITWDYYYMVCGLDLGINITWFVPAFLASPPPAPPSPLFESISKREIFKKKHLLTFVMFFV